MIWIISIALLGLLIWFFVWKHRRIKKLRTIRDNFDFTTPEGKLLIQVYNREIDRLNGKLLFKNK